MKSIKQNKLSDFVYIFKKEGKEVLSYLIQLFSINHWMIINQLPQWFEHKL